MRRRILSASHSRVSLELSACVSPMMPLSPPRRCPTTRWRLLLRLVLTHLRHCAPHFFLDFYQICRRYRVRVTHTRARHSRLHHEPFQSAHGFVGIPTNSPRLIIRVCREHFWHHTLLICFFSPQCGKILFCSNLNSVMVHEVKVHEVTYTNGYFPNDRNFESFNSLIEMM